MAASVADHSQTWGQHPQRAAVLVVDIAGHRCALPAVRVREVLPAARVEPLADAPAKTLGVLSVRSVPVVVIDGRACLGQETVPVRPSDRFIVLDTTDPATAVRVDAADDLVEVPVERPPDTEGSFATAGMAVLPDGLLVVHDVAAFVSHQDVEELRRALDRLAER